MWLAIDTATDRASVALIDPDTATAFEEEIAGARRHGAALLPMIDSLLRRAGATLDDVTGIALSDGPGSFTGLRVGAAVAKALVHTRGLPLWIAPSLMVRAAGVALGAKRANAAAADVVDRGAVGSNRMAPADALVLAVANALRGEVFAAAYRFPPGEVVTELLPSVWRPEELIQSWRGRNAPEAISQAGEQPGEPGGFCTSEPLPGLAMTAEPVDRRPAIVVGDVSDEAREALERWTGRGIVDPPHGAPHAARLIDLVDRRGGAVRVSDVPAWEPVYGRPAEAQVRWEKTHGRPLPDPAGRSG